MQYKKFFEKCLGRKISDRQFYRIKAEMISNNLSISKSNLEIVARIKVSIYRMKIPLKDAIGYYLYLSNIPANLSGKILYSHIQKITNFKPHRTTINRWFDGDFNPDKVYNSDEISHILLKSFIYILRNNHDYKQKSNRKYPLSTKKTRIDSF